MTFPMFRFQCLATFQQTSAILTVLIPAFLRFSRGLPASK